MNSQYPTDWDSRRKKVYRRDNYTCQNCGAKGGPHGNHEIHAHHIVPKAKGGTHKSSNLTTVCSRCHNAIHGNATAPTAQDSSESSNEDRLLTEATFQRCPICNSEEIGAGGNDFIVHCRACDLKLKRNSDGLTVHHINKQLLAEDSPLRKATNYTLAEPAWIILAEKDDEEVDYQQLQRQSKKYEQRMERIRGSKIPVILLVGIWVGLLVLFNSIFPSLLAWGFMFVLLVGAGISLLKYDQMLKKFVFKSVE